ncbi:tyrosine-type recombinase/integrase [Niallia sp. RD1]|uniref:tyrosine-type recombinase/integrase n=1 Tax=Niallia sp. RD1 TaxID=2962858 RepID=UPI0020C19DD7|nr:tyrosine-type recombinase/integrase [Niallia sp. RD1]UTI42129.1 tyrosine-type recombinase/integrase [Niallia sp. RD1]
MDDARNIVMKIKELEGVSASSLANYEKVFNDFDRYFGDKTDVQTLTFDHARDFMYWQLNDKVQFANHKYLNANSKKKGVSKGTANTYLNHAKSIFNILVEEKIVEENIFSNLNRIKDKQKQVDTLTIQEVQQILKSLNKELYSEFREFVIIHCLLDSFGRINEVLSLKKQDVDFIAQTVTFTNTKNGKIRMVPITKKTVKLIEEMIKENEDFNSEYIFLTNHGKPLRPDTFRKHFRVITERLNIGKRIHPHLFRHTASMLFLAQPGASMRALQSILGHSELSTTSIYAHMLDDTVKEQHAMFSPLHLIEEKRKTTTRRKLKIK